MGDRVWFATAQDTREMPAEWRHWDWSNERPSTQEHYREEYTAGFNGFHKGVIELTEPEAEKYVGEYKFLNLGPLTREQAVTYLYRIKSIQFLGSMSLSASVSLSDTAETEIGFLDSIESNTGGPDGGDTIIEYFCNYDNATTGSLSASASKSHSRTVNLSDIAPSALYSSESGLFLPDRFADPGRNYTPSPAIEYDGDSDLDVVSTTCTEPTSLEVAVNISSTIQGGATIGVWGVEHTRPWRGDQQIFKYQGNYYFPFHFQFKVDVGCGGSSSRLHTAVTSTTPTVSRKGISTGSPHVIPGGATWDTGGELELPGIGTVAYKTVSFENDDGLQPPDPHPVYGPYDEVPLTSTVSTSLSISGVKMEYWPYANSTGAPVWDTTTGAQLVDPAS